MLTHASGRLVSREKRFCGPATFILSTQDVRENFQYLIWDLIHLVKIWVLKPRFQALQYLGGGEIIIGVSY